MTDLPHIEDPFVLPCGQRLSNRLVKAAMTEGVADARNLATSGHASLYRTWAKAGAAVQITGNVMIDYQVLERPGNVVIDRQQAHTFGPEARAALQTWASAAKSEGGEVWMQLSHAGRQSPRYVTGRPLAPSPVSVGLLGLYAKPRALRDAEIAELPERFAFAADVARDAGFTGVQIHSAHGYLLSSLLSPWTNRREPPYGGTIEARARCLLETIEAVRARVGNDFAVTVKLNSDDFRKGGFTQADCLQVVALLNAAGIDALELSGGTYEQPQLLGFAGKPDSEVSVRASTRQREAYFLSYAEDVRKIARMPLMVTGGFRTRAGMDGALADQACDLIGIARPYLTDPLSVRQLLQHQQEALPAPERQQYIRPRGLLSPTSPFLLGRVLNVIGAVGWTYHQIFRQAADLPVEPRRGLVRSFMQHWWRECRAAFAMHRARAGGR
ncbi:NADH:flavin oxidoreductase [Ahniella affigens]|uniref:NADH:flavin oxidoreductase n=1 Tax=Ahniella affigens TaxID=2021234 RepID=A0A2P1PMU8_9GAMM|nr:NADH:flavin oxidoreductase/NADH oxidase family protein [Ahniella affigens]AVP96174.1 NADH:flavin oxidoreductase [Ahniella affigens]